ncbi:MAG: type II secretion system inner membrane protein GspF [Sandaracinaceae bacterium]|nr:type II secretion system inner membrane protein GspF [Sandaracinaceae bacterium]
MAVYVWRGITAAGKEVKGVRDADNQKALRALLRKEGIFVTEMLEEAQARVKKARDVDIARYFRRVSPLQLALATKQLATLLRSGVPLVESLSALIDQMESPELKGAFTQARDNVNEGSSFHDALAKHPAIFKDLYVHMVAAGEASGTLELVLSRLAGFLENQSKLQNKVTGALVYPVVLLVVTFLTLAVMMTVVVPKVTAIFQSFRQALPWYTRALIATSDFFTDYWWAMGIAIVGGAFGFQRWRNTPKGRERWDRLMIDLPVLGKLNLMASVARFARTLATLLTSGVPLLNAMEITRNVLGNVALMQVIEDARNSIREGESIAEPLKRSGRLPPIVTHMIAVGERSGQLEEMLENVADSYDQQVDNQVNVMTSLLNPVMILVLAGIVVCVIFPILMPLMRINEFVTGR